MDQRLDREDVTTFSRLEIIAVTVVVWLMGGFVALWAFARGPRETDHLVLLLAVCVIAPSLLIALLCARRINRPVGLTPRGRVACAIWWWFLGSLVSFGAAVPLLWPAFGQ